MADQPPEPAAETVLVSPEALARIAAALEATTAFRAAEDARLKGSLVHDERRGRDLVATILAAGVAVAMIAFVVGAEINVIVHGNTLAENTTQVLVAIFSGVIGGLAGYMGGRAESTRQAEVSNGTVITSTTETPR